MEHLRYYGLASSFFIKSAFKQVYFDKLGEANQMCGDEWAKDCISEGDLKGLQVWDGYF